MTDRLNQGQMDKTWTDRLKHGHTIVPANISVTIINLYYTVYDVILCMLYHIYFHVWIIQIKDQDKYTKHFKCLFALYF